MVTTRLFPVLAAAMLFISPLPSFGQGQFSMKVYLGPMNELEVDATYHDPSDIDERLNGTRVIPIWLSVTNRSQQPVRLDYQDLNLDLGKAVSTVPLYPVDAESARAMLRREGRYNAFLRFLDAQGNDYTRDPFASALPDGRLGSGDTKRGYVFFLRPEGVPFTGFLALGTVSYPSAMLRTKMFEIRSPKTESDELWSLAWVNKKWNEIVNGPPPFRKSYALLLGVSEYRNMKKLALVNNDLIKMEKFLLSLGFHVVRVQNEGLTMANVRSPQEYFVNQLTPDDRLLVYFSGHGLQHVDERGRERGYLALINAKVGVATPETTIAMDAFVEWARRVPAKHLLVLIDACFSGFAADVVDAKLETRGTPTPDPRTLYRLSAQPGRYLVMAGNKDQEAIASPRWTGGLFTNGIVEGLKGLADTQHDGFVTTHELYPWLRDYVEKEAAKMGKPLTPLIKDLNPGVSQGEFVFTSGK